MSVIEIRGEGDWQSEMQKAGERLVVVDFTATWCGPCQFIKPVFHQLPMQYPEVVFFSVDEGQNRSLISSLGVRGFPTFHFYVKGSKVDELVGANPDELKRKIEQWKQPIFNPFASEGMQLGGKANQAAPSDPRAARLKRFGDVSLIPGANPSSSSHTNHAATSAPAPASTSQSHSGSSNGGGKVVCDGNECRLVDSDEEESQSSAQQSALSIDSELLANLQDMGFSEVRSQKALIATNSSSLEAAVTWIGDHQEDPDIDEPLKVQPTLRKPLTEEEKQQKLAELEAKMVARRAEREEREKKEKVERELRRRKEGKEMHKAREEYEEIQRKREAEKRKKEKEDAKRERARLKALLEQDKRERQANGGKLTGVSTLEEEEAIEKQMAEAASASKSKSKTAKASKAISDLPPREQIDSCIETLKQYRVANDGLTALKTLNVYVKNLLTKPEEEKFRHINVENAAFKKRVGSLRGGIGFLKALGFVRTENMLDLDTSARDEALLTYAQEKLRAALATY